MIAAYVQLTLTPYRNWPFGIFRNQVDMDVYRHGAMRWAHGERVYNGPALGRLLYTYTPFSILVFQPLGWLTKMHAVYLWSAAIFATLWWVIVTSFRSLGYRMCWQLVVVSGCLVSILSLLEPVRTTIWYGQINVFLMALVVWDLVRPGESRLRGIATGLAAGIKLTPAFFFVYLLIIRRYRAAATVVATFATTIVIGFIAMPGDSWKYWSSEAFNSDRVFPTLRVASNQSIKGALAMSLGTETPSTLLWLVCIAFAGVLGMVAAWLAHRNGQELLAVTLVGMTMCAVSPFAWGHHWVWFVLLAVYLVHLMIGFGRRLQADVQWGRTAQWRPLMLAILAAVGLYLAVFSWLKSLRGPVHVGVDEWRHGWYAVGVFMNTTPEWTHWFTSQPYLWVFAVTSVATIVAWGPAALRELRAAGSARTAGPVSPNR
ncbi:glycosyltransferase 87 family protein [Jongsikchunia kroppenstedtii]|uniref:glycosyltransferase 87 family protein n=1 Tax=Jongsikchunia kroppenstedtii TaxID=1121721 RepID=UPI001FDF7911|nr:glycosyltransferase 87 family protein [Jongsikchunia kroppenstedtii]